jgi:hypothetical protein
VEGDGFELVWGFSCLSPLKPLALDYLIPRRKGVHHVLKQDPHRRGEKFRRSGFASSPNARSAPSITKLENWSIVFGLSAATASRTVRLVTMLFIPFAYATISVHTKFQQSG